MLFRVGEVKSVKQMKKMENKENSVSELVGFVLVAKRLTLVCLSQVVAAAAGDEIQV